MWIPAPKEFCFFSTRENCRQDAVVSHYLRRIRSSLWLPELDGTVRRTWLPKLRAKIPDGVHVRPTNALHSQLCVGAFFFRLAKQYQKLSCSEKGCRDPSALRAESFLRLHRSRAV